MIKNEFTPAEIIALRVERFRHPNLLVQKKCEALLLRGCGLSNFKIAEILDVTPNTIRNYVYEYLEGGLEELKKNRYKGQPTELSVHTASIEEEFLKNPPLSVADAAEKIKKLTGISRGETQIRTYLKRIGMEYRKTAPIPAKADPELQDDFKKKILNQGLKKLKKVNGWYFL